LHEVVGTYVALLRGINVGRAKRVSMADLRAAFASLGYTDVQTVLQSGNVLFTGADRLGPTAGRLAETALEQQSGVRASVLVLPASDVQAIARDNPLLDVASDPSRLLVTFLAEPPDATRITLPAAAALDPEVLRVGSRALYQWCPDGLLASRVPPAFWKQFATTVTTRNWRTVTRIVDLLP
jgi:uncharacterized protein (DUF1697 family)